MWPLVHRVAHAKLVRITDGRSCTPRGLFPSHLGGLGSTDVRHSSFEETRGVRHSCALLLGLRLPMAVSLGSALTSNTSGPGRAILHHRRDCRSHRLSGDTRFCLYHRLSMEPQRAKPGNVTRVM